MTEEEEAKEKIAQRLWLFRPSDNWEQDKIYYLHEAEQLLSLIKEAGYMTLNDMKGLFFEAQAKKCANCPKNKEG